jgi:hypothetical protein
LNQLTELGTPIAAQTASREMCHMETTQQFETMPALRRKRPKMAGEDDLKRLSEAELLARLAENARRLEIIQHLLQA